MTPTVHMTKVPEGSTVTVGQVVGTLESADSSAGGAEKISDEGLDGGF